MGLGQGQQGARAKLFFFFFEGVGGGQELTNLLTHYFSLSCSYSFIHLGMYICNMDRKRNKGKKKQLLKNMQFYQDPNKNYNQNNM